MQKSEVVQLVATPKQLEDLISALQNLADNLAIHASSGKPADKLS